MNRNIAINVKKSDDNFGLEDSHYESDVYAIEVSSIGDAYAHGL